MPPTDSGPGEGAMTLKLSWGEDGAGLWMEEGGAEVRISTFPLRPFLQITNGTCEDARAKRVAVVETIVRAVNAHEDLLDACEALAGTIEGGTTTSREVALRLAKDAIAKARGAK